MLGWVSRLEIFDFGCLDETTRGCPERGVYDVGRPSHHCAGLDSRLLQASTADVNGWFQSIC